MAGYQLGLKKEQLKVVVEFLSVRNVFALLLGLGRAPFAFKELGGTNCCVCYSIDSYNETLGKHNIP